MGRSANWSSIESRVTTAAAEWNRCAGKAGGAGPRFCPEEQQNREAAYDEALENVEREAKHARGGGRQRAEAQRRVVAVFPEFAKVALGLADDAVHLLTDGFLPVGTQFAQWATRFDSALPMTDVVQACRNAWTVCGIQPLVGDRMQMTPAIVGYSLLYPYSDNFLDDGTITRQRKLEFSARFRDRLCGLPVAPHDKHEDRVWAMVRLIELQYSRWKFPQVYECLLAIHQAQEDSIAQQKRGDLLAEAEILRLSCAKGGTSVLADACLCHGFLSDDEASFAFNWGVLLQLGDDLQDVEEDLKHGSATLFTRAARSGIPLDSAVWQLLTFSGHVADQADVLPQGDPALKNLLRMSWRSLILMAVARSHEYFTRDFLAEVEAQSPFRFEFLRARHRRLAGRLGLYRVLFESFLESEGVDCADLPEPKSWLESSNASSRDFGHERFSTHQAGPNFSRTSDMA
jgi:hypothetical protein